MKLFLKSILKQWPQLKNKALAFKEYSQHNIDCIVLDKNKLGGLMLPYLVIEIGYRIEE